MSTTYSGRCLCGGVQVRIDVELPPVQVCHCAQCRHAQGTPFATNIPVPANAFHVERGAELLVEYESSPGKLRVFCGRCGSPILSRRPAMPDVVRVRAGLIDQPLTAGVLGHYHVGSRCNWWPIADGLPQVEGSGPARHPAVP